MVRKKRNEQWKIVAAEHISDCVTNDSCYSLIQLGGLENWGLSLCLVQEWIARVKNQPPGNKLRHFSLCCSLRSVALYVQWVEIDITWTPLPWLSPPWTLALAGCEGEHSRWLPVPVTAVVPAHVVHFNVCIPSPLPRRMHWCGMAILNRSRVPANHGELFVRRRSLRRQRFYFVGKNIEECGELRHAAIQARPLRSSRGDFLSEMA